MPTIGVRSNLLLFDLPSHVTFLREISQMREIEIMWFDLSGDVCFFLFSKNTAY